MLSQIDRQTERADTMGGQTNTAPAGAGNTDRSLTTNAVKERVMAMPHLSNSSPCAPHRRGISERGTSPRFGGAR